MSFSTDCLDDLPVYEQNACGEYKTSEIDALAVVDTDHAISAWDNATDWTNEIAAGNAAVVKGVKLLIPEATEVSQDVPKAGALPAVLRFTQQFTIMDGNISTNNDSFWSILNKKNGFILVVRFKYEQEIVVYDVKCTCIAKPPKAEENAFQVYAVTISAQLNREWSLDLSRHTEPAGIFD